ncbi:putative Ubiquitin-conjugating enzyme E2 35 [Blattamonas nauphoetae]|uniref:Ubiquitin-conjugating enzyme E2 35 n=1 Tax=Blattamonas nauphoetae TaxID=2049346 RepID=A0ABQ9YLX1_9EUKA|nr:putative Ubiquitin-conjugating enzyme E2 35 [Blattamonas nauphoetae]
MSTPAIKRIQKELARLQSDPLEGITVTPAEDNIRYLTVILPGPKGTCYEGGKFKLEVFCGEGYPMQPPQCRFLTRIYHPNIDRLGRICLDIIDQNPAKCQWTPAIQIGSMLLSIQSLLSEPNVDDPLDERVASHWRTDRKGAEAEARRQTLQHAK